MQPISVTAGSLPIADANAIALAATLAAAGDLTLTSTPYVLDPPRHVTITSAGNDSARTFIVYGTTYGGVSISESLAGTNAGTATTTLDFATVTRISVNGATAGNVEAGYAQSGGSRWVRMDSWAAAQTVAQVSVSGTVTYSVQTTMNDPNDASDPIAIENVVWLDALDPNLVSESTAKSGFFAYTPSFVRIVASGGDGYATLTLAQFSNAPY
jgi:hypothetical protein